MTKNDTADPFEAENTAQTVRDMMQQIGHHKQIDMPAAFNFATADLISLPKHRTVHDVTAQRRAAAEYLKPARRKGTANLTDLESLISWANRFKGENSALFAQNDPTKPSLTCVSDYHHVGAETIDAEFGDATARHCDHLGVYRFPLSKEWLAWQKINGAALDKDALGEHIEAQALDVMDPTPAIIAAKENDKHEAWENRLILTANTLGKRYGQLRELLAMSKRFEVYETSDLTTTKNRDTGEQQIQFLNEHKDADGQPLNIPNLIIIAIPVFEGGAPYRLVVRFRYRKAGGSVVFFLEMYNPEKAFDAAFSEAVKSARDQTELPLFMGTPEA